MLLKIDNLTVRYENKTVLENISFGIDDNDFVGIAGPNGGGKTTLVKAIVGLVPYEGRIEFGKELQDSKGRIGYLPQISNFDRAFPISVSDVILSGLQCGERIACRFTAADKAKAIELMTLTGIEGIRKKPIGELSGGQMQRALLCRALISEPRLLILDEPANFVDSKFETELYGILTAFNERMAIMMVSHDIGDITKYVKRMIHINRKASFHSTEEFARIRNTLHSEIF